MKTINYSMFLNKMEIRGCEPLRIDVKMSEIHETDGGFHKI
jgi:hypothetical protein